MNYKDLEEARRRKIVLTSDDRYKQGIPHHPMSVRLYNYLEALDYHEDGEVFGWKCGGDGDSGEMLMYQMDSFFELLEAVKDEYA